ncbi:small integral membrane protein 28 [Dendropsophus ebraccatus]|uniref:small integral membrane protein 28 n=1 Tax=Dendropsophus ebraccatus TaxID=150705 RepID=UPI0038316FE0
MRWLLDSSWSKFGHAGRGTYEWMTSEPAVPLVETKLQTKHHNQISSTKEDLQPFLCIILPTTALLVIGFCILFLYRKCRRKIPQGQIFAISLQENLPDREMDFFPTLPWSTEPFHYCTLVPEASFLTICLPPPYEEAIYQDPVPPYEERPRRSSK